MKSVITWFRGHAAVILATAVAVSKAGVLSKGGLAIVSALVIALGGTL